VELCGEEWSGSMDATRKVEWVVDGDRRMRRTAQTWETNLSSLVAPLKTTGLLGRRRSGVLQGKRQDSKHDLTEL
jgi:hypothetical protein